MPRSYILLLLILWSNSAACIELSDGVVDYNTVVMKGYIEKGDFKKVVKYLKARDRLPIRFCISSGGGDVIEAIKIGKFIRESAYGVDAFEDCHSACFFILVAGVSRLVLYGPYGSQIGIHRPIFNKEYFSGLSLEEATNQYKKLEIASGEYLKNMGVPTNLIEKMFTIPSDEIYILNSDELSFLKARSTAYGEWIKAKCDPLTAEELNDYSGSHPDKFGKLPEGITRGYRSYLEKKYDKAAECKSALENDIKKSTLEKY